MKSDLSKILLPGMFVGLVWTALSMGRNSPEARWWKGNTHTHTLWSDGRAAPQFVASWYKDHGYHFLVLSDHNQLQRSERWFRVSEDGSKRLTPAELEGLIDDFGSENIDMREVEGRREMRLWAMPELRGRFENAGEFILIEGEEVTSHYRTESDPPVNKAVHINAVNIEEYIPPRGGESVVDLMNSTMEAIARHGEAAGRPVFAHLNHPNMSWSLTWAEVAQMRHQRFFEIFNGHRGVRNHGDETHPSTEEMWDRALTLRLTELGLGILYGVAVDDAHDYYGTATSRPGRGWVMVRSRTLDGDAIVEAMQRGEFYCSTGVTLNEVSADGEAYRVEIAAAEGVTYTTRFVGTRMSEGAPGEAGVILEEQSGLTASYRYRGDELYVRAVVISSEDHPDPFAEGDKEMAWTQPHVR